MFALGTVETASSCGVSWAEMKLPRQSMMLPGVIMTRARDDVLPSAYFEIADRGVR